MYCFGGSHPRVNPTKSPNENKNPSQEPSLRRKKIERKYKKPIWSHLILPNHPR